MRFSLFSNISAIRSTTLGHVLTYKVDQIYVKETFCYYYENQKFLNKSKVLLAV